MCSAQRLEGERTIMNDEIGTPANLRLVHSGDVEPETNDFPHEGYRLQHTQLPDPPQPDLVKSPSHYNRNGIETWDLIEHVILEYPDPTCAYHIASIHKYSDRAPYKGKFYQDLRKAIQHAKRLEKYLDRIDK